jgi:hypothetical protein
MRVVTLKHPAQHVRTTPVIKEHGKLAGAADRFVNDPTQLRHWTRYVCVEFGVLS